MLLNTPKLRMRVRVCSNCSEIHRTIFKSFQFLKALLHAMKLYAMRHITRSRIDSMNDGAGGTALNNARIVVTNNRNASVYLQLNLFLANHLFYYSFVYLLESMEQATEYRNTMKR